MFLLLLLACPPSPTDTDKDDSGLVDTDSGAVDTDTGTVDTDTGGLDTSVCVDMDDDLGDPEAPNCKAAGGVCVGTLDQCGDNVHLSDYDSDCHFDDGDGLCCAAPEPAATGDDCASTGGVCAPIGGCGMVQGWYTPANECSATFGVGVICCAPQDSCEGWGVTTCCGDDGTVAWVVSCDRGDAVCTIDGSTLMCDQDCPVF